MGRVLLVKLGAIGDAMMLLPAAQELHAQGHAIEWLCGEQISPLLGLYPWITTIVADEAVLLRGGTLARLQAVSALWRHFAGRRYDLIATVYYDRRYRLLTRTARARRRLWLSTEDRNRRILPGRHHSDELARLLLGRKDDVRPAAIAPVPPPVLPASPVPRTQTAPRIVLVPAGAKNLAREDALRRWPVENFVAVARELLAQGNEVLLSGGPGDGWASAAFTGLTVLDCIGRHTLVQTVGLFGSSDVVVTPDTGPLHLAGVTAASIVALFGPTSPHYFLPQRPGVVALWGGEGFACRPCYDGKNYAPCRDNACVQQVTPAMVLAAVNDLLQARREGMLPGPRIVAPPSTIAPALLHPGQVRSATCMADRALFLDRDGVINEEIGYLIRPEDVRFVPGIVPLCQTAQRLGYRLVVVTNQSGIARGLYTEADFETLMQWIRGALARDGIRLDAVYHCPFHPEHGTGAYRREHEDRKPSPGMLRRAAADLGLDLAQSIMIGDRCSDVAAANAAGLRQAFLLKGTETSPCPGEYLAIDFLDDLKCWLLADEGA